MVIVPLTEQRISAGRRILNALDDARVRVTDCLWLYTSDRDDWRLIVSSPELRKMGPLKAYKQIQDAIADAGDVDSVRMDITVGNGAEATLASLRKLVKTGNGVGEVRLTNNVVDGRLIEDVLIYRLK